MEGESGGGAGDIRQMRAEEEEEVEQLLQK